MKNVHLYLIKPTRYDDDGYPIQWWRSMIPSNSLACVAGIVQDAVERQVLGDAVDIAVTMIDETNEKVDPAAIIARTAAGKRRLMVFLVGVQTNQFPRAVDIARPFRAAGIPVCIGGFHVSGCLSMLKDLPPDLQEAQALGISFFAGEAEDHRIDEVIADGYAGALKPIYNHVRHTPNLAGAPLPMLGKREISRIFSSYSSFDLGRGCPFECSFCTIINVQGRKSRFRTPDDLEQIIRRNAAIGVTKFFLTDDNFVRNKHWEQFLDRLIALKAEGLTFHIAIQVDTLAHKIPRFIEKCYRAGCDQVFIGLENINADSLEAAKKRQNRVEDYREMFLAWKKFPVVITCGYIIGFPNDTKESILHDIEVIKNTFPIDTLYLNYLTPLPGSEDHKTLYEAGIWMDPDMSKYDLNHRVTHHPKMSDAEWEAAHLEAHRSFYSFEHMHRVIRRMAALKSNKKLMTINRLVGYREAVRLEGCAKLEAGLVRLRHRRQRRHGMPIESPLRFYPWHWFKTTSALMRILATRTRLRYFMWKTLRDPKRFDYTDAAISRSDSEQAVKGFLAETRVTAYAARRIGAVRAAG
ncbi:radical SAM protein [Rhizobium sp. TRM95111]|uniref:B12-binding domain-containing radical SAM protein n=1 Tax=Rhizobium alarense TaxID=2846851 RepID=UPI001F16EEF3|nr:radical SAM protein [Rhizobium alarense]MCF3638356.1 radical SAM protein [Rhizobium alarense]